MIERFVDDDPGYMAWSRAHPHGFVVNCLPRPSTDYLIFHRADCWHITDQTRGHDHWTRDYTKVCSEDRGELLMWCYQDVGGAPTQCPQCDPMAQHRPSAPVPERRTATLPDTEANRRSFLDRLSAAGPVDLAVTEWIMEWSSAQGLKTAYTAPKGKPPETFIPLVTDRGININPFGVKVGDRRVFLGGSSLRKVRPFSNRAAYDDLLRRVFAVPGMVPTKKDLYPNIRLVDLAEPDTWAAFVEVMEWVIAELRRAAAG